MRSRATIVAALAALTLAIGCGGEERDLGAPQGVPAAGENTPPAGTPGVPEGAPYDLDGNRWKRLSQGEQFDAAAAYVEDNPERCEGADVGIVAFYVTNSYSTDFPLEIPAADVLAEGCDAALQS